MTEPQSLEVCMLISRALDGALTEAEYAQLHRLMANPQVQAQYFEQLKVDLALRDVGTHEIEMGEDCDLVLNPDFWCQLARAEQNAPAVKSAVDPEEKRERVVKVEYEKTVSRVNRTSLVVAISALAALLFLLIYINSYTAGRIQVATVMDTHQSQWVGAGLAAGGRVDLSAKPLVLLDGVVKMTTDEGVDVVIEGPAEFRFTGASTMEMTYGRLFARVNPSGIGFSVSTPVSRVIDLGTAFGVRADLGGNTELHVFEGKTSLSLKERGTSQESSQIVTEGQAKHIDSRGQTIREIDLEQGVFVADIDSQRNWVYRGQKAISLADIIGGGNGLGTGRRGTGIHPVSGAVCGLEELDRRADNRFVTADHPFVDGVFVPDGSKPQVVSSRGHVFAGCPVTQGNFYTEAVNTPLVIDSSPLRAAGMDYQADRNGRCLFLHANLGITYDLSKIRRVLSSSGEQIRGFRTEAGISESAWRDCNADIWVLVDGKVRYSRKNVQAKGLFEMIDIELTNEDRFLTLVATDGGDPDLPASDDNMQSIDSDWCVFNEPVLILE